MKQVSANAHMGDSGVALIHREVNRMGFIWHGDRKLDAGIDGEIELRNPATGEATNKIVLVQSKARGTRPFAGETDSGFHFICDGRDVDYWMAADVPVLLVCSHPDDDEAWWMHVQPWFRNPANRASRRVDFDKTTCRLDKAAAPRILAMADPHATAHTVVAQKRPERLVSNLVPVTVPPFLFSSPIPARSPADVYRSMRAGAPDLPVRHDWVVRDGRLWTLRDPAKSALRAATTAGPDVVATKEWTTGESTERDLVRLLNRALVQDVGRDCDFHKGRNIVHFRATPDLRDRRIVGGSGLPKQVFHARPNREGKVTHYVHAALRWQFQRYDEDWLCALTPEFHYTRDGHGDYRYYAEQLAGIKRLDRNPAVLGHVRMWAAHLKGSDNLLDQERDDLLGFGDLLTFDCGYGIDDQAWLDDPAKAAAATQTVDLTDAPALFSLAGP